MPDSTGTKLTIGFMGGRRDRGEKDGSGCAGQETRADVLDG